MNVAWQAMKRALTAVLPRDRYLVSGPTTPRSEKPGCSDGRTPVEIALTFDDGPHPEWTPAVLDALASAGWTGTFFVIGERAEQHPELVRRIVAEGHAIGNHTYTHSVPGETSTATFLDEVRRTDELIKRLTGIPTALVRPPLGKLNWGKFRGLWTAQRTIVLWNVDPKDFAMREESGAALWAGSYCPRSGDIVLLHDRHPYAAAIVRTMSLQRENTFRSVAISEWLAASTSSEMALGASDA